MAASTFAVTPRVPQSVATAIQQRITSGNHFDGTLPQDTGHRADSPLYTPGNAIYKYPAESAGGLFFWNSPEPLVCSQIHIDLGAAANITVSIVNLDPTHINDDLPSVLSGESLIIEQATNVQYMALDEARFKTVLLPYQAISIVTTASGAAQIAQVVASLERTYVR